MKNIQHHFVYFFLVVLVWPWSASGRDNFADQTLVLSKGEYLLIPKGSSPLVHNASSKLLKVSLEGASLRLLGRAMGETTLAIGSRNYRIIVTSKSQKIFAEKISGYLRGRPGLYLVPHHPQHQVIGELLRWTDWEALKHMALETQGAYNFKAEIAPENRIQIEKNIAQKFTRPLWGEPAVVSTSPVVIEFPAKAKDHLSILKKDLSYWGLEPQFSENSIDIKPMIRIKIVVAEINRQKARNLGIAWPGSYQASLVPIPKMQQDWELTIHALEAQGTGRILANPSLLSRSGETAEFLAGGEIPILYNRHKSRDVIWKRYGINLQVLPQADQRGHLKVQLTAEVSSPDSSFPTEGLPAFKTHRVQSHFNLRESRTIAISGLLREEQSRGTSGLPGLSQIPILGRLFSSENFLENRSELVIMVTPEIVDEFSTEPSLPSTWNDTDDFN